jgi:hypothetical protein
VSITARALVSFLAKAPARPHVRTTANCPTRGAVAVVATAKEAMRVGAESLGEAHFAERQVIEVGSRTVSSKEAPMLPGVSERSICE